MVATLLAAATAAIGHVRLNTDVVSTPTLSQTVCTYSRATIATRQFTSLDPLEVFGEIDSVAENDLIGGLE